MITMRCNVQVGPPYVRRVRIQVVQTLLVQPEALVRRDPR